MRVCLGAGEPFLRVALIDAAGAVYFSRVSACVPACECCVCVCSVCVPVCEDDALRAEGSTLYVRRSGHLQPDARSLIWGVAVVLFGHALRRTSKDMLLIPGFHLHSSPYTQIGADGANSLVRRHIGASDGDYTESYAQMGLVATVRLLEPDEANHTAWQRFLPDGSGVLAVLPLSAELSSIVWSTQAGRVRELLALDEAEFVRQLNEQLVSALADGMVG